VAWDVLWSSGSSMTGGNVAAVELDPTSLGWLAGHTTAVVVVVDASGETVAARAIDCA
jgi:hypothetical protein